MFREIAGCSCSSDIRCPHDITRQLEMNFEDLEKMVDKMFSSYSRTMIQEYLDGNNHQSSTRSSPRKGASLKHAPSSIYNRSKGLKKGDSDANLPKISLLKSKLNSRPKTADQAYHEEKSHPVHIMAWGSDTDSQRVSEQEKRKLPSENSKGKMGQSSLRSFRDNADQRNWSDFGGTELLHQLPAHTSLPLCLHYVIDTFIRRVLPWQSFLCRRAIESLRDLRSQKTNSVYEGLLQSMTDQLNGKVQSFLKAKYIEITQWGTKEVQTWDEQLVELISVIEKSLFDDVQRQFDRDKNQQIAQSERDLSLTNSIEQIEKDTTEKQIQEAKRLCNSEKAIDSRMLQVTLSSAHARAGAQQIVLDRSILKKHETAHEWLRCVADNAITASVIEGQMKRIVKQFQSEKKKVLEQYHQTKLLFDEQCELMFQAINQFSDMVISQANDHINRERLLYKGFLLYLTDLQCQSSDLSNSQEISQLQMRSAKHEKLMIKRRAQMIRNFEDKKQDLCQQLHNHYQAATSKILDNIRHRDALVEVYLKNINMLYRKFVQFSCNRRRSQLTRSISQRKSFFYFEDECLTEISSLLANIRFDMDGIWRKEHMIALYLMQSVSDRLNTFSRNHSEMMKNAFDHLSCNLEGENSNIAWVIDSQELLKLKGEERKFAMKQFRRKINIEWVTTLKTGLSRVQEIMTDLSLRLSAVSNDVLRKRSTQNQSMSKEDPWERVFSDIQFCLDETTSQFVEHHQNRHEKEKTILMFTFTTQKDFIEKTWKENIMSMNSTLLKELKGFFRIYCQAKDELTDLSFYHEVELQCFEQAVLARFEEFWKNIYKRNRVFSQELVETLSSVIINISQQHEPKGYVPQLNHAQKESTHFLLFQHLHHTAQTDDHASSRISHDFPPLNGNTGERKLHGEERFGSLDFAVENIDFSQLFSNIRSTDKCSILIESPMSYIEIIHVVVATVPSSRVKHFLNHLKNELRSLPTIKVDVSPSVNSPFQGFFEDSCPMHLYSSAVPLNLFSYRQLKRNSSSDRTFPQYTTSVSKAFKSLHVNITNFLSTSKLVPKFVEFLSSNRVTLPDKILFMLENSCSFAIVTQVFSCVSVYSQLVDIIQVYEYIRQNIKTLCATSLHLVGLLISSDGLLDSSQCHVTLPAIIGVWEMLQMESSWIIAALGLDEDFPSFGSSPRTDYPPACTYDMKMHPAATSQPTTSHVALGDLFERYFSADGRTENSESSQGLGGTFTSTAEFLSNLRKAKVPDQDLCVFLGMMNNDDHVDDHIINTSVPTLQVCVRLWRLCAYSRLQFLSLHTEYVTKSELFPMSQGGKPDTVLKEIDTLETILADFDSFIQQELPFIDNGELKVHCRSPFDSVGALIHHFSGIPGCPFSYLQTICLLASSSGFLCDPWITDLSLYIHNLHFQTICHNIIDFILKRLLRGYWKQATDPLSSLPSVQLLPKMEPDTCHKLSYLNSGTPKNQIPYESLREYCEKQIHQGNGIYNQTQLTIQFWCAFHHYADDLTDQTSRETPQTSAQLRKLKRDAFTVDDESDSPFPPELIDSLPLASNNSDKESGYRSGTQSVIEMLDIGDTVDSFTDTLGNISDSSSSFLSSSYSEIVGVLNIPLRQEERRQTLIRSLDSELAIHQPLPQNVTIWCQKSLTLDVNTIPNLINSQSLYPPVKRSHRVEHYPNASEVQRQIELRLLLQYKDDITPSEIERFSNHSHLLGPLDLSTESADMSEYWRHLSASRLSRIQDFIRNIRSVMSDNWTEMIMSFRKERYHARAVVANSGFENFKKYLKCYREETLKQRAILKELYSSTMHQIQANHNMENEFMKLCHQIYADGIQLYISSLKSILSGYQTSKLSFLKANWHVYERKKAIIEDLQRQCYLSLGEAVSSQNDHYRADTIGHHFDQVKASKSAGYHRYQSTTDNLALVKNKFLTSLSRSWKEVNDEVTKSIIHFEYLLGDLLIKWYENEKIFQQSINKEKSDFHGSLRESIDRIVTTQKDNTGKVFEFYKNMEAALMNEIFDPPPILVIPTITAEQHETLVNGRDSPIRQMLSRSASNASGTDSPGKVVTKNSLDESNLRNRIARRLSREPLTLSRPNSGLVRLASRDSSLLEDGQQFPSQDTDISVISPLIKLRDKFRLFVSTSAKLLRSEKHDIINLVKENRKKRNIQIKQLQDKAEDIRHTWDTIRSDLINMLNLFIAESRERHVLLSVDLMDISKQYRLNERDRLSGFRECINKDLLSALTLELTKNDQHDEKIFYNFNDQVEDVLIATNKEINEIDHQPAPLRSFIRELDATPGELLNSIRSHAFDFHSKYPCEDDLIYQFLHTAEQLSLSLDHVRKICHGIMDEYVRDKRETYKRLQQISKCETMLDCKPQVSSVLDMMINTIEAEDSIRNELNEQTKAIAIRSSSINTAIDSFLSSNTLPASFLDKNGDLPNEEDLLQLYGPCKLHTNVHHHHGICNNCVATLLSTISRNNVIVNAKLDALGTHIMVMRARENEIDKAYYLDILERYDDLHQKLVKDLTATRLKILSILDERCTEKDPLYKHGNSQIQIVEQLSEASIFDDILANSDQLYTDQNEVIAALMKKANLTTKEQVKPETTAGVGLQQSPKSAFYGNKSTLELQTILSLSPHQTMDSADVSDLNKVSEVKRIPMEQVPEPELSSISTFLPQHGAFDLLQPAPERKHVSVPLLPLKESIPQVDNEYFNMPYGWEERVNDDGTSYYFHLYTGEKSYDIHPSLLMANNWRKCMTDDGEEYYYNDESGVSCWDPPSEAFDDNNSLVCSLISDRSLSLEHAIVSRPDPPIPPPRRRLLSPPSSVANSRTPSARDKASSAFSSVRERGYSIDIVEDGYNTVESLGNLSYDALYARTVENNEDIEALTGMYDTFANLYSKAQTPEIEANELGDGVTALETFDNRSPEYHGVTGYSSNDADGDVTDGSPPQVDSYSVMSDKDRDSEQLGRNQSSDSYARDESDIQDAENADEDFEAVGVGTLPHPLSPEQILGDQDPFANNPNSWVARRDESGNEYYENTISGETTWEAPSSFQPPVKIQHRPTVLSDPTAWQMYFTDNGIPYYFNSSTGESRWTTPSDLAINNEMIIRSGSVDGYMKDLTPIQSQRERYDDIYSLLGTGNPGDQVNEEDNPYLINLMDFTPKSRRKISELL